MAKGVSTTLRTQLNVSVFLKCSAEDQATFLFALRFEPGKRSRIVKRFLLRLTERFDELEQEPALALLEVLFDCRVLRARAFIRRMLRSSDPNVRFFASDWLRFYGQKGDLALLKPLYDDHRVTWPFGDTVSSCAHVAKLSILGRE
jgi:hypothetical protein